MADKTQIVFIMTDTQRWDMVGCYRDTGLRTPNIDALAADGVRYERAYTTQPVCGPARAGLFTGLYPSCSGSWANGMELGDNVKTVGQRLRDNGIHCAYIGKWHLDGTDYFGNGFCPDGWDPEYWYDMRRYLEELSEDGRAMSRCSKTMDFIRVPEDFTYGSRVFAKARDFMERYRDEDYFLVVSFDEPHGPFLCPPPYDSMYADYEFPRDPAVYDTLEGKPGYQKIWAAEKPGTPDTFDMKARYFFGCNSYADELIGKTVAAAPDSAVIIYTSDHGDLLHSHSLFAKGPAAYDAVARIPFIIRDPKGVRGGVYRKHPVSHIDVVPTILEWFGIPIPKVLQGGSIRPTVSDLGADTPSPYAFIEFTRFEQDHDHYGGFQPMRAVTDGRYKLSVNLMSTDEFYDLEADPFECKNLIDTGDPQLKAARDRLHDAILDRMCRDRDPFRGYYWDCRPWRTDAAPPNWRYRGWTRQRENEEYEPRQLDFVNGLPMKRPQRLKISNGNVEYTSLEQMIEYLKHYDE